MADFTIRPLQLALVWPHNDDALRLYEKFGFEREGVLRGHYRRQDGELWDAIVTGRLLE
jgi:RimJ/RimL family protein N-acetyltransferase